ncbi:MAG: GAP family protein [Solirubrobacterales bacterium]|nr:GAP family protein [Solirubrobacterales bacterium]
MLRLIGLVVSIGIADSLNPTTIAPALYLASGERPRRKLAEFTIAVFAVYLLGGAIIALGPGHLLFSLIPHPRPRLRFILETAAGVVMLVGAAFLWGYRGWLSDREMPDVDPKGKSSAILGATITAVELPTAFPYFAAIAAIVGSGLGTARQIVLLVVFNACFVLPLVTILGTLTLAGSHAERILTAGRNWLQAHWPALLAGVALVAGLFVTLLGVTGLTGRSHGHLGRVARRIHRLLHLHP